MEVNERRTVVGGLISHCVPPQQWREIDAHDWGHCQTVSAMQQNGQLGGQASRRHTRADIILVTGQFQLGVVS